ncbi:MAG: NADH:flavin oxidoreductase [Porticoccaceae bacterium]|nr:NADH:flavin oxidoreductase [Porticoccaceae bacterium]
MQSLFDPLSFHHGPTLKNRFALAPLTNLQSHKDGRLSDDEHKWLTMRAEGGFALTMSCAAHVQAVGQGFPGQLGIFSDAHLEGLSRLAKDIKQHNSLAVMQLHHAGMRSPEELIGGQPVAPSDDEETGARALSTAEVEQLIEDFIAAAERAEKAGFDGVELHGAHGYMLCQFLSGESNRREDQYGGSLENRARPIFDIITGIRKRCRNDFNIGIRLSPERFGMQLMEVTEVAQGLMTEAQIDYIDLSLWDVFKEPNEEDYQGRSLLSYFTKLERGDVRIGVAGKIRAPQDALRCLDAGADFVLLGRAAILHHDFPKLSAANNNFVPVSNPVSEDYLRSEGLGEAFVEYMGTWKGFVEQTPSPTKI